MITLLRFQNLKLKSTKLFIEKKGATYQVDGNIEECNIQHSYAICKGDFELFQTSSNCQVIFLKSLCQIL